MSTGTVPPAAGNTPPTGEVTVARRYGAKPGPIPAAIREELDRAHWLVNRLVEIDRECDEQVTAVWEADPQVGPVLAAVRDAEDARAAASEELRRAKVKLGAVKSGRSRTGLDVARARVDAAREAVRQASAALKQARDRAGAVKQERWPAAAPVIRAAQEARDAAIRATYPEFVARGGYWATWNDITGAHKRRRDRVQQLRRQRRPAQMRYKRRDGTGTLTVQLQRQLGVSAAERAHVTGLRDAGLAPSQIAALITAGVPAAEVTPARVARLRAAGLSAPEVTQALVAGADPAAAAAASRTPGKAARRAALGEVLAAAAAARPPRTPGRRWRPQSVARVRAGGKDTPGDPPFTPDVLAGPAGPAALQVRPVLPPGYPQLPRRQQRALARQGEVVFRTGSAANAAYTTIPVVLHRPLPAGGDVKMGRLTVTRCGPDLEQSVSITARVPAPPPAAGHTAAVHIGWRALGDGAIRVAVITGPRTPPPRQLAEAGVVRPVGGCWEVVVPPRWQVALTRVDGMRSARDREWQQVRDRVAAAIPPGHDTLPPPAQVRAWRSPGRMVTLAAACEAGEHGGHGRAIADLVTPWARRDRAAWRNESRARRRILRRRDDAWAVIAAWLTAGAGTVIVDDWELPPLGRRPGLTEEDDPQWRAARANRVLAAPGALRARVRVTAELAGVAVAEFPVPRPGQAHAGCGHPLDPDARREDVLVPCLGCGVKVDQDINMLTLMLDGAREGAPQAG